MINNAKDTMKLKNAKDLDFPVANLPQMGLALHGWMQFMHFITICKQNIDGYTEEIKSEVNTHAVRQPLQPTRLDLREQGERTWQHEMLHALPDLQLNIDDRVQYLGTTYRVVDRNAFPEYGYIQYNVTQDFDYLNEAPEYE